MRAEARPTEPNVQPRRRGKKRKSSARVEPHLARRRRAWLLLAAIAVCGGILAVFVAGPFRRDERRAADRSSGWDQWLAGVDVAAGDYPPLQITYPFDEALFPPEIVAPTFHWKDPESRADTWLIRIEFPDGNEPMSFRSRAMQWRPEDEQWEAIKRRSLEREAEVAIFGINHAAPRRILSAARISIGTSKDEVGAPVFYREVNLPFIDAVKDPSKIRWRFGDVSSKEQPRIVLEGLPVCGNCHSFSADGTILGMDVDYANDKGSYVIAPTTEEILLDKRKVITWSDYRREDGEKTFGLLSQVSPDGKYVVSTVKDRSVFVDRPDLAFSQLFFPVKGILVSYCRETQTFHALPGADDKRFVQSNPTWSPDGKTIVFARHEVYHLKEVYYRHELLLDHEQVEEFLSGGKAFKFDLYRIPFNDGKGGKPEPLEGASHNGMSNYFPKYSPDGKWIVFCKAKTFMLLQPDSQLYIMPASGGRARRMRCNTSRMNSWHSWSPNSKWLVFSSKLNGPYTQLFLTHIDEQGRSSPAVLLEHFTAADRAANIPEFVNLNSDGIRTIRQRFVDDHSYARAGDGLLKTEDLDAAARAYRKALQLNPSNPKAHSNLGVILLNQGMLKEAQAHFAKAVEYEPDNAAYQRNMGDLLVREQKPEEAMGYYREALRVDPKYTEVRINLGLLLLMAGRLDEGTAEFAEAVRLDPQNAGAHYHLARALRRQGKLDQAVPQYRLTLDLDADALPALMDLATIQAASEDRQFRNGPEAVKLALRACVLTRYRAPKPLDILAAAYAENGQFSEAIRTAKEALQLARDAKDEELARQLAARLQFYLRGAPIPAGH
jgi:tetratricopeptide (TPR) repeat protein